MLKSKPMKLKTSACVILIAMLIAAMRWSAQHHPRGAVAGEPRAEKSDAPDATRVFTDEDLGPVAISEKDDPPEVVNKAAPGP